MRVEVVVIGAGAGRWRERNRALEETEADVLAFLDDDVEPPEDWLGLLTARWRDAEAGVAAIGGPVTLRFDGGRPEWATPALDVALGALDHGNSSCELDPLEATLVGGNLSFRVWHLAAAGGFKATPDESGDRDWFAEEHEAQRELGRWGWRVMYAPELRVERVIAPRRGELMRARFRYGARQGRAGSRARGPALRQAATSAAGLPAALARREAGLAAERAARLAESLGTALSGVGGSDVPHLLPVPGGQAPGDRHRLPVPGGQVAGDRRSVVLLYHRVARLEHDPLGLAVSPRNFEEQLAAVAERAVPLAELVRERPGGRVAVTFDDGYADNLYAALPLLEAAGVPATVFASTGHIASGDGFFWDELTRLLMGSDRPARLALDIGGEHREWATATGEGLRQARYDLHHLLQPRAPEVIEHALAQLRGWAGIGAGVPEADRAVTVDELKRLARGVEIGAHTRRHVSLRFQPAEVQRAEVEGSRDDVAGWTGMAPAGFSYPFGVPGRDFVRRTQQLVRDAGFAYAVGNHPGWVTAESDTFSLPRVVAPNVGGSEFARTLETVLA